MIQEPPMPPRLPPMAPPRKKSNRPPVGFFVFAGIIIAVGATVIAKLDREDKKPPSCATEWSLCATNADMANQYRDWTMAQVLCKSAATGQARYGSPSFPWLSFSSFLKGTTYKSGIATLIEPDAQFPNGFGAMVHSQVSCQYDLVAKRVLNVTIEPR